MSDYTTLADITGNKNAAVELLAKYRVRAEVVQVGGQLHEAATEGAKIGLDWVELDVALDHCIAVASHLGGGTECDLVELIRWYARLLRMSTDAPLNVAGVMADLIRAAVRVMEVP